MDFAFDMHVCGFLGLINSGFVYGEYDVLFLVILDDSNPITINIFPPEFQRS
jgi:hypothetical protein